MYVSIKERPGPDPEILIFQLRKWGDQHIVPKNDSENNPETLKFCICNGRLHKKCTVV